MKRPSFQFYPGDWLNDAALRACSVGARGLWMDMLCLMHQGSDYGHLKVNHTPILTPNLARMCGATLQETEGWLNELSQLGVFSKDDQGCIFSRRMIRDENLRSARAAGGKLGGNPALRGSVEVGSKVNLQPNLQPTPSSSSSSSSSLKDVFVSLRSTNNADPQADQPEVEENFTPEKPKKTGYQVPQCPYDKIAEAYAQHLPSLPQIAVISTARKRAMQARWRDVCAEDKMTADEAMDFFRGFFAGVAKSKFLMGRASPGKDGRTFKADFDWLMVPANFLKVFEGRYHERSAA